MNAASQGDLWGCTASFEKPYILDNAQHSSVPCPDFGSFTVYTIIMANQEGYEKVAALMSCHTEFAIFRRFGKLSFLNLLYLQAELANLEVELKELAERDKADPRRKMYSKYWWRLAQSEEESDDREQWHKVLQVREKLKEYSQSASTLELVSQLRVNFDLVLP